MTTSQITTSSTKIEGGNVTVTTWDCSVTEIKLETQFLAGSGKMQRMPIVANGTVKFNLPNGEHIFYISFSNSKTRSQVTVDISTDVAEPMRPAGPLTSAGFQYQTAMMVIIVTV